MFLKLTGLCAFLALLSVTSAYKITPNVVDNIPGFLNITTAPFVKIGSSYYFIESKLLKNWYDAYENCRKMGAELIEITNSEKLSEIFPYLVENKLFALFWTSGTDMAKQGKHIWFTSGNPVSSDLWLPGEPNNVDNIERCDELEIHKEIGGLNDKKCESLNHYICEAPKPKTASFVVW